jgi:hypothetical protein
MSLTVDDIRAHAELLEERLEEERRRVRAGKYSGHPAANLRLIAGLEGRVAELRLMCDLEEVRAQAQMEAALVVV